jgi:hypothetical protein
MHDVVYPSVSFLKVSPAFGYPRSSWSTERFHATFFVFFSLVTTNCVEYIVCVCFIFYIFLFLLLHLELIDIIFITYDTELYTFPLQDLHDTATAERLLLQPCLHTA